jgi:hypothetical protein
MSTNDLGPSGAGVNATTTMPAYVDSGGNDYTWFKDCTGPEADDGTRFTAQWANRVLLYIRQACDGMSIARDEADGDRLLKAIQKADKGLEDVGSGPAIAVQNGINTGSNNYKFRKFLGVNGVGIAVNGTTGDIEVGLSGGGGGSPTLASLAPWFLIQEQRAGAASALSIVPNTWTSRVFTTDIVNQIAGASRSGATITLPAGTYRAEWEASVTGANNFKSRLWNSTDGASLGSGLSVDSGDAASGNQAQTSPSIGRARFTIAGTKDLVLQCIHRAGSNRGAGDETNISPDFHVDAQILFVKEA